MKEALCLNIAKILEILPHRYPMLMLDRVTELVPSEYALARKMVSCNEPWCQGNYPERPIMPGVLILEALSQTGSILVYASEQFDPQKNRMYYLGMDKCKFRHTVTPGDQLDLRVEVLSQRSNTWKFRGEATVDGALCAQVELTASVVDHK